jgi:hypothetical protein
MLRMGVSVGCGNRSNVGIRSSTLLEWKNYMKDGSYLLLRLGDRFRFPK